MAALDRRSVAATFARSFLIQGSWNYRTMIGSGFAFAMLPALRRIFSGDDEALEASVRRHAEHFNAHPYLSNLALGASLRMEADGVDPETVRRFKTAVRGPLGGLGDGLVWAAWLPAVSLAALALLWLGAAPWVAVTTFLIVYNAGHLALRAWAFAVGLESGRAVGQRLGRAALGRWTERVRVGAAVLLGVLVGAMLVGERGVGEAGALWGGLCAAAFLGGLFGGRRTWRPTAVAVVLAVVLATFWGGAR